MSEVNYIIPPEIEGKGRNFYQSWEAARKAGATSAIWHERLLALVVNQFTWDGLPDEIPPYVLETCLVSNLYAGFTLMDDGLTSVVGRATPSGPLSIYALPLDVRLTFPNAGFVMDRRCDVDCVIGFDNQLRTSTLAIIDNYAERLSSLDSVIDVNLSVQRTPIIGVTSQDTLKSANNLLKQIFGENVVIAHPAMAENVKLEILDLKAPYVADKVLHEQLTILQQFLTFMGIDTANTQKRERLIESEALSNNEETAIYQRGRLTPRRIFADKVNKMFGFNITVKPTVISAISSGDIPSEYERE